MHGDRTVAPAPGLRVRPLRVLHLSSGNLYGGVERIITSLATFRDRCPSMSPTFALAFEGRQAEELRAAGVAPRMLGEVRLSRPLSLLRARRALVRSFAEERPDVVVCHNPWPLVVFGAPAKRRGIPVVVWVHGAFSGKNALERLARRARPDLVVANSRFSALHAESVFPGVPRAVVYAPAEFSAAQPVTRMRIRKEIGASSDAVVILQASRIEASKGHEAHLAALATLRADPTWEVWFAGGAQQAHERLLMDRLRALSSQLGIESRVKFLGERTDVADLLAAADIFCQPNKTPDAFGLAFVEALAAGVPVLTTRMGGAIEIVDESCGILVPPDESAAFAAALRRLIEDPVFRRALGAAGPARARQLCDPVERLHDLDAALGDVTMASARPARAAP